ncbi:glucokinase [Escherichia coli]|uniref:Glucokinase n=1 Tax=Escherichia coli TaxID=562 RepID=A0A376TVE6_ECOLX|nr:glucokinase [Escherichia coli]
MTKYALVGDVGGTNARLALCDIASGEISQAKTYSGLDYPSLEAVIRVYLEEHKGRGERRLYCHRLPNYRWTGWQ